MDIAVFVGLQSPTDSVYSEDVTERLFSALEFPIGKKAVGKEELCDYSDILAQVKYIFTTWGMFSLTEVEIKRIFPALKGVFYAAGSVQSFAKQFLACGVSVYSAWAAKPFPLRSIPSHR